MALLAGRAVTRQTAGWTEHLLSRCQHFGFKLLVGLEHLLLLGLQRGNPL
ncbi:MAG: hypothetical protein ACKO7W_11555 [Elainella sp.]